LKNSSFLTVKGGIVLRQVDEALVRSPPCQARWRYH